MDSEQEESSLRLMDYLLLIGIFLETLADNTVERTFILFFSENLHLADTTSNMLLVGLQVIEAFVIMLGGRWFDYFPRSGPLRMFAYANPVRIAGSVLVAILYLRDWSDFKTLNPYLEVIATVALCCLALGNGFTHLTIGLAVNHITPEQRGDSFIRRFMSYKHGVMNAAILISGGIYLTWRRVCGDVVQWDMATANAITLLTGSGIWILATGWNAWLSTLVSFRWNTTKDHVPRRLRRELRAMWRRCVRRLGGKQWRDYAMYSLVLFGTTLPFSTLAYVMPKYLIRRFDQLTTSVAFDMINPTIVILLTLVAPGLADRLQFDTRHILISGSVLIGLSPLLMVVINSNYSGVFIFLVILSMGEAITIPNILTVAYSVIDRSEYATYNSMNKPVAMVEVALVGYFSSLLLDTFCPTATVCKDTTAPLIWLPVSLIALTTPVLLYLFGVYQFWWDIPKCVMPGAPSPPPITAAASRENAAVVRAILVESSSTSEEELWTILPLES